MRLIKIDQNNFKIDNDLDKVKEKLSLLNGKNISDLTLAETKLLLAIVCFLLEIIDRNGNIKLTYS